MNTKFKHLNTIIGWVMFAVASTVYISTTEPTVPLWDCPEYTATAVKLEVGHPAGAPLYQMMGAVISNMFDVEVENVAFVMNVFACLSSAVAIMLLFWIITFFARRILGKSWEELSMGEAIATIGSGIVGSSAILFSDTFWFNATESEVYSLATLFTVLLLYFGIRWINGYGRPRNNKWLILVALMTGLAPGVHFMGLLGIPVVAMMYYYECEDKQVTVKRFLAANAVACGVLVLTFGAIFPFLINSFGTLDVFFVNTLGMPFHSGTIFWAIFLAAAIAFALWITARKGWIAANTIALALMMIVIGFTSYLMIPIRANANTPINENNPSTAEGLNYYLSREQYGKQSLLYGPSYNALPDYSDPYIIGKAIYEPNYETGRYDVIDHSLSIRYQSKYMNFFPRIANDMAQYRENYKTLTGLKEGEVPTFGDNLRFFITYQLGHMNMRYFLWNFSGRQNDYQGRGEPHKGNWITGIRPLDEWRLGPQNPTSDHLGDNAAHNVYYMLPLLLGLAGMFFHFLRHQKDAYCVLLFFIITGIGITLYTNNPPYEPRERDYALVVSFWTFGIWIGLGVLALYTWISERVKVSRPVIAALTAIISFIAVPTLMAAQNWDDHDRSTRSTGHATGLNYLSCVGKNGIMVTYGDNDTFPLWYMQEMEGYRTDVRVVNTSLLMCDWYVKQFRSQYYDSAPLPLTIKQRAYTGRKNETVYLNENSGIADKELDIKTFINLIAAEHPALLYKDMFGDYDYMIPTTHISIPVNKENAVKYGIVDPLQAPYMEDSLHITIGRKRGKNISIDKKTLAFLDFLSNYEWDRPIHFGLGAASDARENMFCLNEYVIQEGMTYKLVPFRLNNMEADDAARSYDIITRHWEYGGIELPSTYLTEFDKRSAAHMRSAMIRTTRSLLMDGDTTRAREIINTSVEKMPINRFEVDYYTVNTIKATYQSGQNEKADELARYAFDQLEKDLLFYISFPSNKKMGVFEDAYNCLSLYNHLYGTIETFSPELEEEKSQYLNAIYESFLAIYPFLRYEEK